MSAANARLSSVSIMALPPYLITTVAPWNSVSHGSASISVVALPRAIPRSRPFTILPRSARSCRVRRVLVHVSGGQVVGPDRRRRVARVQVDGDPHGPAGQVDLRPV